MARTTSSYLRRIADHHGAADLGELASTARRDLGQDDVAVRELAAGRRLDGAIVRAGAQQEEVVLGAECFHVVLELEREPVLGHSGRGDLQEPGVAELGDARRLAGKRNFFGGLGARRVEDELVGRTCFRERRSDRARHSGWQK
jgi:hypothetical protein